MENGSGVGISMACCSDGCSIAGRAIGDDHPASSEAADHTGRALVGTAPCSPWGRFPLRRFRRLGVCILAGEMETPSLKWTEGRLDLLEAAMRRMGESVVITTGELDPPGPEIVYVNEGFCRMTGYAPEEVVGKTPRILQGPKTERARLDRLRRCLSQGEPVAIGPVVNYRKDGSEFVLEWTIVPLLDASGRVTHWVASQRDITNRERAEEERRRTEALERAAEAEAVQRERISRELHDRVGHSIAVVHQSLELHKALKGRDPEAAEARLALARRTAKEALDSTRGLSTDLRRQETESGLEPALRDLLDTVVPPGVELKLSFRGDETTLPPRLHGQLFLILREAVRNAVAHSGCGRLTVGVEVTPRAVSAHVEDDGAGLGPQTPGRGEGLGLGIMRERASLFGGTLTLSSSAGEGTRVEVWLPLPLG